MHRIILLCSYCLIASSNRPPKSANSSQSHIRINQSETVHHLPESANSSQDYTQTNQSETTYDDHPETSDDTNDGGIHYFGRKHKDPGFHSGSHHVVTLSWAIKITDKPWYMLPFFHDLDSKAITISDELGLVNKGQIGHLDGVYLFEHLDNVEHMRLHDNINNHVSSLTSEHSDKGDSYVSDNGDSYVTYKGDSYASDKGDSYINDRGDSYVSDKSDSYVRIKGDSYVRDKDDLYVSDKGASDMQDFKTEHSTNNRLFDDKQDINTQRLTRNESDRYEWIDVVDNHISNHLNAEMSFNEDAVNSNHRISSVIANDDNIPDKPVKSGDLDKETIAHPNHVSELKWRGLVADIHRALDNHPEVEWYTRQIIRRRKRRSLTFKDPMFRQQWHLVNYVEPSMDINVTGVWERNVTGHGVTAVVVDDGLEWTVTDIRQNYKPEGSWDLNSNDANPLPDTADAHNHHGTRCAGEIAAAANTVCGVGVAYNAGIAGIRVLDGPMTDSLEATAFTKNFDINDIYSCSWGPDDDGKTVDGPHHLANVALRHGVDFGRQGYGSIYVVASGNGGSAGDNCNFDGYANSIFTITIGAVDESGSMPYYAEECASMLAVTFSSGNMAMRSIVTTDWAHQGGTGCTTQHTGTSAAAPLAAGMIALALDVRPCLTWRDIQHLIVVTALKVDIDIAHWQKNAAGLHHSHKHGFGLMNAWRLVNAAKVWEPVPWMTVFSSDVMDVREHISTVDDMLLTYEVSEAALEGYNLFTLEYVQVTLTIEHRRRGDLQIALYCPSQTYSVLGAARPHDDSDEGFTDWTFSTVRCWGEKPQGTFQMVISDLGKAGTSRGRLITWSLKLFGSAVSYEDYQEKMRRVQESYSGQYLNDSYQASCPPPPDNVDLVAPISEKLLKILLLTGSFVAFMAVYESLEYLFCYNEEKKEHSKLVSLYKRAQDMSTRVPPGGRNRNQNETSTLLGSRSADTDGEMIPLAEIPANGNTAYQTNSSCSASSSSYHGNGSSHRKDFSSILLGTHGYQPVPLDEDDSLLNSAIGQSISKPSSHSSRFDQSYDTELGHQPKSEILELGQGYKSKSSSHPNGRAKNQKSNPNTDLSDCGVSHNATGAAADFSDLIVPPPPPMDLDDFVGS